MHQSIPHSQFPQPRRRSSRSIASCLNFKMVRLTMTFDFTAAKPKKKKHEKGTENKMAYYIFKSQLKHSRFVPTYHNWQNFFLVCSDTDLCRLLFVSAQRHTGNNPKVLTRGGFEDQAIAILDSKLHGANLSGARPEGARLNYEWLSHILTADQDLTVRFPAL